MLKAGGFFFTLVLGCFSVGQCFIYYESDSWKDACARGLTSYCDPSINQTHVALQNAKAAQLVREAVKECSTWFTNTTDCKGVWKAQECFDEKTNDVVSPKELWSEKITEVKETGRCKYNSDLLKECKAEDWSNCPILKDALPCMDGMKKEIYPDQIEFLDKIMSLSKEKCPAVYDGWKCGGIFDKDPTCQGYFKALDCFSTPETNIASKARMEFRDRIDSKKICITSIDEKACEKGLDLMKSTCADIKKAEACYEKQLLNVYPHYKEDNLWAVKEIKTKREIICPVKNGLEKCLTDYDQSEGCESLTLARRCVQQVEDKLRRDHGNTWYSRLDVLFKTKLDASRRCEN